MQNSNAECRLRNAASPYVRTRETGFDPSIPTSRARFEFRVLPFELSEAFDFRVSRFEFAFVLI
jgi:hypothetical protein